MGIQELSLYLLPFLKAQKEGIKYIFGQQDSLKKKH